MEDSRDKRGQEDPGNAARAWAQTTGGSRAGKRRKSKGHNKRAHRFPADIRRHIFTLIALAVLLVICIIGFTPLGDKITQGLDIKGGVSVVMTASKPDGSAVTDEDMEKAVSIVQTRVNSLGASEATVQQQGSTSILIQIPGATDAQQAIDTMGRTGLLEFVDLNDIGDQDALLKIANGQSDVELESGTYTAFMTGDDISNVTVAQASQGSAYYAVNITLTSEGAEKFAEITKVLAPTKGQIAIVLDGVVNSAPAVQSEITTGEVSITGNYTLDEAKELKTVLDSGSLPVSLEYSESRVVGPTLGQDSLTQGLIAMAVGFAIVVVYMLVFYQGCGLITTTALLVFGVIYLGLLAFLSWQGLFALSLPGIAGTVLTIGMAADSSILVLERFREELRMGRSVRKASVSGSKHGIRTAIDAGVVSLISALSLLCLSVGQVKGFGLTLALGVLCQFFTLLCYTTPMLRILGHAEIARHPGFWGVRHDIEEGARVLPDASVKGGEAHA